VDRMGLTAADLRTYHRGLLGTHWRRIELQVLNLEGKVLRSLTPRVLDGQVVIDVNQGPKVPSRICAIRFLDPARSLGFEPQSIGDAPMFRSRMIRVVDSRFVPGLDDWVDCDVFTGPIWDFERDGAEVSITAHGKERLLMGSRWKARNFAKKSKKTTAIRTLATDAGETHLNIPDLRYTFPHRFQVGRMDVPWFKMDRAADSLDRHLFYNGSGKLRLRSYPTKPVLVFNEALLSEPTIHRVPGSINTVWVVGHKPKGPKKRPQAVAVLPDAHPMSPETLERNDAELVLAEKRDNPHLKTIAACKARAQRIRDERARITEEYRVEVLPWPNLDEHDIVGVDTDEGRLLIRMKQWTIPLGPTAEAMPIGSVRRTTMAKAGQR